MKLNIEYKLNTNDLFYRKMLHEVLVTIYTNLDFKLYNSSSLEYLWIPIQIKLDWLILLVSILGLELVKKGGLEISFVLSDDASKRWTC